MEWKRNEFAFDVRAKHTTTTYFLSPLLLALAVALPALGPLRAPAGILGRCLGQVHGERVIRFNTQRRSING